MEKDKYEYPKKKYEVVSHMVAWVIRILIESLSIYLAVAIFFIVTNWKLALSILIVSPFVFLIIYMFKTKVAPMYCQSYACSITCSWWILSYKGSAYYG